MSAQTPTAASVPKDVADDKKGIGRMLSRVKTVLRGGESVSSSKRRSTVLAPVDQGQPTAATTKTEPTTQIEKTPMSRAAERRAYYEGMQGVSKLSKSQLFEERAKKLGERFGLNIDASEWQTTQVDNSILRMDKPIRMRVRRTCHNCKGTFANAKECPNCQHVRCSECTRHPPKRTEAEVAASRERRAAIARANKENPPIVADYSWEEPKVVLKRPSKTGGQDLIHKKPRQRVRRSCHECQTQFVRCSKKCGNCGHARCTDCPRDPPKKDKYPLGYPGDEFGPSSVPHYECDLCQTLYPTGAEHGTSCKKCGRQKSENSPRARPRKVERDPDPEVLRAIQAKLDVLQAS